MNIAEDNPQEMAVISDRSQFDESSGWLLERLVFNNRIWLVIACSLLTVFFAYHATHLLVNASYEKMLPHGHPYIKNFLQYKDQLRGFSDTVRVVVENTDGRDIYNREYLETLGKINDEIFLLHGVDRPWMKSLYTPVVRWVAVTEDGFMGSPVLPQDYDGSPQSIERLRINVDRAGVWGSLVSNDYRSSMIVIPLMTVDAEGKYTDYRELSESLEKIRAKYEGAPGSHIKIHIIGFAKLIGDLIEGLGKVIGFFGVSAAIATLFIYLYTRCIRSTVLLVSVALVSVIWLLGLMQLLGYVLNPYSILVPFLIFAIGLSHGAQKMNGVMQDVGRGTHKYVAARYTFRRLFVAGLTALLTNVVGFAVLMIIDIPVIRELALTTSMGVSILIFTKLIMIPVGLSYIGVSQRAAAHSIRVDSEESGSRNLMGAVWMGLTHFTRRGWAIAVLVVAGVLAVVAFSVSLHVKYGDLDKGAPELRANSRYNLDNAYITSNYGTSSDVFAAMVKSPIQQCGTPENLIETDRLAQELALLPGVQKTDSLGALVATYMSGQFEGNPKWQTISDTHVLADPQITFALNANSDLMNLDCWLLPVVVSLADHKAETLDRVVKKVEEFKKEHDTADRQILLAAGNAGVEAATNIVVKESNARMLVVLYLAVIMLCFITFRNWRGVLIALIPLVITSMLCEALMVWLGIGIKVATLPVIALGVGVGVDYALYLLSIQLSMQRRGQSLADAYRHALQFTGKIVALVGITMAAGVVTWAWSPIKFQADMGILLTFMFLWNMIGALVLIPALSYFLLDDKYFAKIRQRLESKRKVSHS